MLLSHRTWRRRDAANHFALVVALFGSLSLAVGERLSCWQCTNRPESPLARGAPSVREATSLGVKHMDLYRRSQVVAFGTSQRLVERVTDEHPVSTKPLDEIVRVEVTTVSTRVTSRVEGHSVGAEVA
jgi:hypothetical protein